MADAKRGQELHAGGIAATAAHDLRAHLAGLLGVIETLRAYGKELDEETTKGLLDDAAGEAELLFRLIEAMLAAGGEGAGRDASAVPIGVRRT